ncbi:MAG TPA: hypothetical protein PK668_12690 [Myxococcota bacterium]|nr:hypothetical protein [Myxococcota bacterium]HRY93672.1 hypothetical protein [Myxococcota bacterium]
MDDSHDWFADVAESFVRYLAARDGLEVFGAGKWVEDAACYDRAKNRWYRFEVRSTDRARNPIKKGQKKLQHADILVEVKLTEGSRLSTRFKILRAGRLFTKAEALQDPSKGHLLAWLRTWT